MLADLHDAPIFGDLCPGQTLKQGAYASMSVFLDEQTRVHPLSSPSAFPTWSSPESSFIPVTWSSPGVLIHSSRTALGGLRLSRCQSVPF